MPALQQAFIYFAVAVVLVPLGSLLGLGSVLGYLIGGVLIGPAVLGLVKGGESIAHFAELGVVLMLFMIGLELDLRRLWGMRRQVFGGGTLQFVACGAAAALLLLAFGLTLQMAVVGGLALALSSTAIAVQTMNEQHLDKTPVGRTAFSILLFQDIAAIPLIALIPILGGAGGGHSEGGLGALKGLGAIVGIIAVGRYLTRPILRFIAKTGLREVFTAFSLLLVLGIAELMEMVELSMGLGAFLAGVLLASSEFRHALESDLQPFKGLLLGLFFISVGMTIDLGLIADEPVKVIGLTLAFLALKLGTLRLIAGRLGVSTSQRWLFAARIAQGGEFAFVVFKAAAEAFALPPGDTTLSLLTVVVALSMAMTPFILILHNRLFERHGKKASPEEAVEDEGASVIIAGFGRVGQIIGRFLFASGVKATVLDRDPDQIKLLEPFGYRVFYGDATRIDLLEAAGAARARLLIVAIDDPESSEMVVERVREHFPNLEIIARARNVGHYAALRRLGVKTVERETFEGSLVLGRKALEALGCPPFEARESADAFRRSNVRTVEDLLTHWDDPDDEFVALANQARRALEEQFEIDRKSLEKRGIKGWHFDPEE
jgi:glutathione-regulated potassium-efflux system ancillary protein KefC